MLKNLVVTVSYYKPTVHCTRQLGMVSGVGYGMLDLIPFDWNYQLFGPPASRAKEHVDVIVPKVFTQQFIRKLKTLSRCSVIEDLPRI